MTAPIADRVTIAVADGIADVRLNRPDKMNALDPAMFDGIVAAMDEKPDLIMSVGNDLVDALAVVTASHLEQQFLVLGAEVAEPTGNVTAVDWNGASFRGEGLGASSDFDPTTFTAARCADAVQAGAASVLLGQRGVVLWLD
jgi:hypothetical protein